MKIALLSCVNEQKSSKCRAGDMYSNSDEFKTAYSYAGLAADKIYLLSSKYGLLETDDEIAPWKESMDAKPPHEKRLWTANVMDKLSRQCDPGEDEFILIARREYYEYLLDELKKTTLPLENVPDEYVCSELKKLEKEERAYISALNAHRILHDAGEYTWDRIDEIPFANGVYIMFEKNESFRGYKRITSVGTHRGDGNLRSRLETHFIRENKNWSIFRKNIGRALLNRDNDPYLKIWDMVTDTHEARQRYGDQIDEVKESGIEKRISMFLRSHITFTCIEVESWFERLRIEEGLIATLNRDPDFRPSKDWFGRFSPEYEMRNSGMWLKRGLDKTPLKRRDMDVIERAVSIQKRKNANGNALKK